MSTIIKHKRTPNGFTLVELLIVIAIIGILSRYVVGAVFEAREASYVGRANLEFETFSTAIQQYLSKNFWQYPPDADRNVPPGLEAYLGPGRWPDGPWPGSVYDWDVWDIPGEDTIYQISIRFCPVGGPLTACRFPKTAWAENFNINSAYFYCFEGPCRSHRNEPIDYPGYCVNCACKEMESCP